MSRRRAYGVFGGALAVLLVVMSELERRMRRTGGPGIVPFELAGSPERSRAIVDRWGADGRSAARLSLLLDYPFLVSYTGLNVALTGTASDALRRGGATRLADAGAAVGAMHVAAGACDAAENAALLGVLAGGDRRLPAIARGFAGAKFALLALGWLYVVLGLAGRLIRPPRPGARAGRRSGRS